MVKRFTHANPIDLDEVLRVAQEPSYWRSTKQMLDRAKATKAAKAKREAETIARQWQVLKTLDARVLAPRLTQNRPGPANKVRIARAMSAGRWYGAPDIRRLTGLTNGSVQFVLGRMRRAGLLEREQDPDWRAWEYVRGVGVQYQAQRPPRWLYRLTAAGEALGGGSDMKRQPDD